jgi:hypothetical protein
VSDRTSLLAEDLYFEIRTKVSARYLSVRMQWTIRLIALITASAFVWFSIARIPLLSPLTIGVLVGLGAFQWFVFSKMLAAGYRALTAIIGDQTGRDHVNSCREELKDYNLVILSLVDEMAAIDITGNPISATLTTALWAGVLALVASLSVRSADWLTVVLIIEFLIMVVLGYLTTVQQGNANVVIRLAVAQLKYRRQEQEKNDRSLLTTLVLLDTFAPADDLDGQQPSVPPKLAGVGRS